MNTLLECPYTGACDEVIAKDEHGILQSILLKLVYNLRIWTSYLLWYDTELFSCQPPQLFLIDALFVPPNAEKLYTILDWFKFHGFCGNRP